MSQKLFTKKSLITPVTLALLLSGVVIMAQEKVDLSAINRIKAESLSNSKVMDTMFYLTDVYGPRLTNSPNHYAAGEWAKKRLEEFGLVNVHLEKWGPFGRAWSNKYYEGHMVEPRFSSLIAIPLAWTSGTGGSITGEPVMAQMRTEADMEKFKGKLKGKIVMSSPAHELPFPTTPEGTPLYRCRSRGGSSRSGTRFQPAFRRTSYAGRPARLHPAKPRRADSNAGEDRGVPEGRGGGHGDFGKSEWRRWHDLCSLRRLIRS